MSHVSRILLCQMVLIVACVLSVSNAQDVEIGVTYELDDDEYPTNIALTDATQTTVKINYEIHWGWRLGKTDVEWKIDHPDPKAENTDWTLVWKGDKEDYEVCPPLIRFVGVDSQDVAECEAHSELNYFKNSEWSYKIVATSTDDSYKPRELDPAIVFRKGIGTLFGLLFALLVVLFFGYQFFFKKKRRRN